MSSKENFNQISPSEFFYRNRDLAGFSNPTRSLYTAVREFVENSLDACDHSGILPNIHMTIKAVDPEKPDPKQYILTVKDNGPGIPPELHDQVFFPMVSVKENGSGLGLTIAQDIIRIHGGGIIFKSNPGETIFAIQIPIKIEDKEVKIA